MHTTTIDTDETTHYTFHHNGGYDGDVLLTKTIGTWDDYTREYEDIEIPFDVLKEFVGHYMMSRAISGIEDMTGKEFIDASTGGS